MRLVGYPDEDTYITYIKEGDYTFDLKGLIGKTTEVNFSDNINNDLIQSYYDNDYNISIRPNEYIFKRIIKEYGDINVIDIIESNISDMEERKRLKELEYQKEEKNRLMEEKRVNDREMNKIKHGVSSGGRPKLQERVSTKYDGVYSYSSTGTGVHYNTLQKGTKFTKHMNGRYLRNEEIVKYFLDNMEDDILIIK